MPLLRLPSLPRRLHAADLGRANHAAPGVPELRQTHDDLGEGGWELTMLRQKLIKTGAKVVIHARYVIF